MSDEFVILPENVKTLVLPDAKNCGQVKVRSEGALTIVPAASNVLIGENRLEAGQTAVFTSDGKCSWKDSRIDDH